jgi:hypothetical protein
MPFSTLWMTKKGTQIFLILPGSDVKLDVVSQVVVHPSMEMDG